MTDPNHEFQQRRANTVHVFRTIANNLNRSLVECETEAYELWIRKQLKESDSPNTLLNTGSNSTV